MLYPYYALTYHHFRKTNKKTCIFPHLNAHYTLYMNLNIENGY